MQIKIHFRIFFRLISSFLCRFNAIRLVKWWSNGDIYLRPNNIEIWHKLTTANFTQRAEFTELNWNPVTDIHCSENWLHYLRKSQPITESILLSWCFFYKYSSTWRNAHILWRLILQQWTYLNLWVIVWKVLRHRDSSSLIRTSQV